jgi:hypothetical protein
MLMSLVGGLDTRLRRSFEDILHLICIEEHHGV